MAQQKVGWFNTPGRLGDRTLEQQMTGLVPLLGSVSGKSVLDIGCAEGLIALKLLDAGASAVHGVEHRKDFVEVANKLRGDRAATFEVGDANEWAPKRHYDVVLMLAILQKLRNPAQACMRYAQAANQLVVLRLPPKHAPVIIDERSHSQPFDMHEVMVAAGFEQTLVLSGHLGEWVGFYERVRA